MKRPHPSFRLQLECLEDRCLLSAVIHEFPIPSGTAYPNGITAGPGGLWFTDADANQIDLINPITHAFTRFTIPTPKSSPGEITLGADGNLWFTEVSSDKLAAFNPITGGFLEFSGFDGPRGITTGPDGNIWFTEQSTGKIGEIVVSTHAIHEFSLPGQGSPSEITADSAGNLWFTEQFDNRLGVINAFSHGITEIDVPSLGNGPDGIVEGPDGNLWFTQPVANMIGVINRSTHAISEFSLPKGAGNTPKGITVGVDGNLWFTEESGNQIGNINPATHVINQLTISTPSRTANQITLGPDGNLWFTAIDPEAMTAAGEIGQVDLGGLSGILEQVIVTIPPGTTVTKALAVNGVDLIGVTYNHPRTVRDEGAASVVMAVYPGNPTSDSIEGAIYFDFKVTGAIAGDTATVEFHFPVGSQSPALFYHDDTLGWVSIDNLKPLSLHVDTANGIITVVLDGTHLQELNGTIFTVQVIVSTSATPTSINPQVATLAQNVQPLVNQGIETRPFTSTSQRTLILTPSQTSTLPIGTASSATGSSNPGIPDDDLDEVLRTMLNVFYNSLFLLARQGEGDAAPGPAANETVSATASAIVLDAGLAEDVNVDQEAQPSLRRSLVDNPNGAVIWAGEVVPLQDPVLTVGALDDTESTELVSAMAAVFAGLAQVDGRRREKNDRPILRKGAGNRGR